MVCRGKKRKEFQEMGRGKWFFKSGAARGSGGEIPGVFSDTKKEKKETFLTQIWKW